MEKERTEMPTFSIEQINLLLENDNIPYVDSVLILIFTGYRPNEMLMLEKSRINLENRINGFQALKHKQELTE